MAEEFIIKSQDIEDKINQLLPSQGGFQAGVDFSASTMVIPIVDLTETAEGSSLRMDLQTSLSLGSVTAFNVSATTTTIINTTGYFRIFGNAIFNTVNASINFTFTDGTTSKILLFIGNNSVSRFDSYDFVVFLKAGDSITVNSTNANAIVRGVTRQIADLAGNLVNPI